MKGEAMNYLTCNYCGVFVGWSKENVKTVICSTCYHEYMQKDKPDEPPAKRRPESRKIDPFEPPKGGQ